MRLFRMGSEGGRYAECTLIQPSPERLANGTRPKIKIAVSFGPEISAKRGKAEEIINRLLNEIFPPSKGWEIFGLEFSAGRGWAVFSNPCQDIRVPVRAVEIVLSGELLSHLRDEILRSIVQSFVQKFFSALDKEVSR